jgi:hypothetical protein
MKKYSATLSLFIDTFEAEDLETAKAIVGKYIDHLIDVCEVNEGKLTWSGVDHSVEEEQ